MGIMAGVNTVLMDDPKLTCRIEGMKSPIRIICDTHLRTPLSAQVVQTASEVPTIIATIIEEEEKKKPYTDLGCQVWTVPADKTHIDLKALMKKAGEMCIRDRITRVYMWMALNTRSDSTVHQMQNYICIFQEQNIPCLLYTSRCV